MSITIRVARPEEAETIWQLTLQAYTPDRDRLDPPSGVFRETVADVERAMADGVVYVALRDGALVGAARVRPAEDEGALYCGRLAVAPAAQRQGIGTALMQRIEQHAREGGYAAVVLGVRIGLPENLLFYERLGYRTVRSDTHGGYAGPTFLWLRKDV